MVCAEKKGVISECRKKRDEPWDMRERATAYLVGESAATVSAFCLYSHQHCAERSERSRSGQVALPE